MAAGEPGEGADRTLGRADDGRRVRVAPGATVFVSLPDNPTTGYRWELEVDHPSVRAGASGYEATPVADGVVGSGGRSWWVLEAVAPGVAHVTARRRRPWEDADAAVDRFGCTVEVRAPRRSGRGAGAGAKMR